MLHPDPYCWFQRLMASADQAEFDTTEGFDDFAHLQIHDG